MPVYCHVEDTSGVNAMSFRGRLEEMVLPKTHSINDIEKPLESPDPSLFFPASSF
jgi:hypothetical protein